MSGRARAFSAANVLTVPFSLDRRDRPTDRGREPESGRRGAAEIEQVDIGRCYTGDFWGGDRVIRPSTIRVS